MPRDQDTQDQPEGAGREKAPAEKVVISDPDAFTSPPTEPLSGKRILRPSEAGEIKPPAPPGVKIEQMPPLAKAGVDLAQWVLTIVAGAIVLLLIYLVFMELTIGADVSGAYKQALNPSRIGAEFLMLARLEQFSADLNSARKDPAWKMPENSLQNAQSVLRTIAELPSVPGALKSQLNSCVPLPADASRNGTLDRCIDTLERIRQAALEAAASAASVQAAGESVGKIHEQRQALHQFWIQAAQLILLNLLLPLLTALFGYIFGTQQRSRSSGD